VIRRLLSPVFVSFLLVLVACAEQGPPVPDATLAAAAERTVGAESFRVRLTVTDGREQHESQVDYVAPDRVRIKLRPRGETIWIGGDAYYATPERPARFVLVETSCENPLQVAVPALDVLGHATDVRRNGPDFVFRSSRDVAMTGEARIEDGYVASLLLRYRLPDVDRTVIERYSFSGFGRSTSIRRPDASSVRGAAPNQGSLVPCPEKQP